MWIASRPGQELRRDVLRLLELQRPALLEHLEQGLAVHVLHGHQLGAVGLDQVEDPADVGGDHLAGGPHLAAQHLEPPLVLEQVPAQRLERHLDPQLEVEGPPHLAHAAPAEHLEDLVALAQHLAGGEQPSRHGVGEGRIAVLSPGRRLGGRAWIVGAIVRHLFSRLLESSLAADWIED